MKILFMLILCIYSLIFLSSSFSKIFDKEKHINIILDYRILPTSLVVAFYYFDLGLSLTASIGVLIGFYVTKISLVIMLFLLCVYTLALVISLLKSDGRMNCGCGGILGESGVSWKLVARNLVLLLILFFALYVVFRNKEIIQPLNSLYILLMTGSVVYLIKCLFEYHFLKKEFKRIKG